MKKKHKKLLKKTGKALWSIIKFIFHILFEFILLLVYIIDSLFHRKKSSKKNGKNTKAKNSKTFNKYTKNMTMKDRHEADARRAKVKKLWKQGYGMLQISKMMKISSFTVYKDLKT